MKKEHSSRWRKLDNAAQAFPAATGKKDTRVFRFYCQLKEDIQADLLQKALEQTMEHYPVFSMVLRKGLFWFYLEQRDLPAKVEEEKRPPCSEIYVPDHKTLLFQVSYYKTRINFEVFHALTDGTGAMLFLKELVSNYLILCHPEEIFSKVSEDMLTETDFEEDSFSQYYTGKKNEKEKSRPAYQIKGEYLEQEEMEITEILLSAEAVHKCAKAHGVSVTAYLAAALVYAVYEEIPKSRLKKPVSLMVPANLRNFFPSASMTNFWSWIEIACDLGPEASFEDALQITGAAMQKEALKQEISTRMNDLVRIERNPVLRAVPLEIKNLALTGGFSGLHLTALSAGLMLLVSLTHTAIPYAMYFGAMVRLPTQTVALMSYLDPITALILSALVLHEPLSPAGLAGAVLVLGSTILSELWAGKKQ